MTDETPAAPRRTRRRAAPPEPTQDALIGVMADAGAGPAVAPEPGAPGEPEAPAPEHADAVVEEVPATVFRLERGGIAEATAGSVEVRLGGIGRLDAEEVFVQWGGVGAARADRLGVEFGSVGAGLAGELKVTQGVAGSVLARDATLEQSFVRTLIALARNFHVQTVAEWVLNEADAALLCEMGVDFLQGYFIGAPDIAPAFLSDIEIKAQYGS